MLAWIWGKGNGYSLFVGVETHAATMEISAEVPQKARNRSIV